MGKIIAVSTNKGGVLKTSLTTNIAGVLSKKNKILIVDTDNQGNASLSFGINPDKFENSLYDVMMGKVTADQIVVNVYENIDILPSNDDMSFLEFDVLRKPKDYKKPFDLLKTGMGTIAENYDYVLIDTPPNLGLVTGNVMAYADEILIPFQPEAYSMRSLVKILKSMKDFSDDLNPKLKVKGIVATLVDSRTNLHTDVMAQCKQYCEKHNIKLYDTVIPRSIKFADSVAYKRLPATLTDSKHKIVAAYKKLVKEAEL